MDSLKKMIFWLDTPPVVCKGVFKAVSEMSNMECWFIYLTDPNNDRSMITDKKEVFIKNTISIQDIEADYGDGYKYIDLHDDIYIFNGYKSRTSKYLDYALKNNRKCIVWAERPCLNNSEGVVFGIFKGMLYSIYHTYYAFRYRNKVKGLLALGEAGVKAYLKLQWPKRKTLPFLYVPLVNENVIPSKLLSENDPIKLLYVGRFSKGWKGTDILIKACQIIKEDFNLTFVGGYGDYKDETLEAIKKDSRLQYGGTWKIDEVCEHIREYDVCIVPSRFEGWNVTVNEAIISGIGCIVSSEAVSDELIDYSGAGTVFSAGNEIELANAIREIIHNRKRINDWKQKAQGYRKRISSQICAKYMIEAIDYLINEEKLSQPEVPWKTRQ